MVVDDNFQARAILKRRLESAGYLVAVEPDAQTALERLGYAVLDVVLVDLILPGTGGERLIARLAGRPDIRVVAMSGAPERLAAVTAKYPHVRALPKPFTTEQLLDAISAALAEEPPKPTLRTRLQALLEFLRPSA